MISEVMWSAWDGPGLGHLRLTVRGSGVVTDGIALGVEEGQPFRLAYEVRCDAYWRVRAARVGVPSEPPKVELLSDGEGNWTGPDGRAVTYLKGCGYVDIAETPFTNTLPIRRLDLAPGGPPISPSPTSTGPSRNLGRNRSATPASRTATGAGSTGS